MPPVAEWLPLLRLSIVVPTNESGNVHELLRRLEATLGATEREVIFVDDDSPDGAASTRCDIARADLRVRCLQWVCRCGLSSACIEGMLATAAPTIAVIAADLQHDETILPKQIWLSVRGMLLAGARVTGTGLVRS